MDRNHHDLIQNFKAELEARDICTKSIYALRGLVTALASGDDQAVKEATRQAKVVLNSIDHSTR